MVNALAFALGEAAALVVLEANICGRRCEWCHCCRRWTVS
jgi:hypothetical protein